MSKTPIVAFLQNQWFKNPERARRTYAMFGDERRHELNARFLFAGCTTGRNLQKTFGPELCDRIIWEETSREVGDRPSSIFPADMTWMCNVMRRFKPAIVLTFGKHAEAAFGVLREQFVFDGMWLKAMHPAARHPDLLASLRETERQLRVAMLALAERGEG